MKRPELIEMHGHEETIRRADDGLRVVLDKPESPVNAQPQNYGETTLYQGGVVSSTDDSPAVRARIEDQGDRTLTYAAVNSGMSRYATEHESLGTTDAVGWANVDRRLPEGGSYKHVFGPDSAAKATALVTKLAGKKIDNARNQ